METKPGKKRISGRVGCLLLKSKVIRPKRFFLSSRRLYVYPRHCYPSELSSRVISIHFIMASERVLTLCLFLVCCLTIVYCKKIDFKFCISKSDFYQMLMRECGVIVRKSIIDASNPVETSLNARSFLRGRQFKRGESGEPSRPTDYIEECCIEGCRTEEVMEYC
ncbi:uncharacterized protein LOC116300241 isoform X1 [Actinia tenebrosa]|uniref:Uncharacterized protein LOC116300241 isoform X1 n=1 Tax=Actinia tenebrosa TaxID=6105 RepID=A0A6P8IBY9_ACTTE|nr:uncharacterized protein LOC116300241 isoform X1 [Actinia tenebrosa]